MDRDAADPRLTGEYVRRLGSDDSSDNASDGVANDATDAGDVTLVGVVHNHPASKHRIRAVLDEVDPAVLGLELPPVAVPLYDFDADDWRTPPRFGGEMSTAIQAAATDRVVGIDGPDPGFVVRLVRNLLGEDASLSTARSVLSSLAGVTKRAVGCRLAAAVARTIGVRFDVSDPAAHDCSWADPPAAQARDERAQVERARTIAETFEQPATARVRDRTRDQHMASRLSDLRQEGDVVAVVGIAHLDPVCERL
jgi:pheromone shutdown protein TraB